MKNSGQSRKKLCGNCRYHNTYNYPDQVFCFVKFQQLDNPVISTLEKGCDQWEYKHQECLCLEDTMKKNKRKT